MPKRLSHRWERVITAENCITAVHDMLKGKKNRSLHAKIITPGRRKMDRIMLKRSKKKRYRKAIDYYRENAAQIGLEVMRQLASGEWRPEPYREKRIYDEMRGKWRALKIPCLFDQCVHHAVMRVAIPDIMARKYYYDCGSVPGAGQARAVDAVRREMARKNPPKYALTMDIKDCYNSCAKAAVMARLRRLYKDKMYLAIHERILDSMGGVLAIGFFPSPWYCNLVLCFEIDRVIKHDVLRDAVYVRYADDMVVLHNNKRKLRRLRELIESRLRAMGMRLKKNWQIFPTAKRGIAFLSYVFGRGRTLVRKQLLYRISRCARRAAGGISPALAMAMMSYRGILARCNSYMLRKRYIDPYVSFKKCKGVIRYVSNRDRVYRAAAAG